MKQLTLTTLAFLACINTFGQSKFPGYWQGDLKSEMSTLTMVFNIEEKAGKLNTIATIPQQIIVDYKNTKTNVKGDSLFIVFPAFKAEYRGVINSSGDKTEGVWLQNGESISLVLDRKDENSVFRIVRTQEPLKPYPYFEQELSFENKKAKIKLSGTLTLPDTNGKYPVVVLVSGSGPQDRNEELAKHKPFLVIADYLTRHGIAVYRYDDRGVGKSQGKFQDATTLDFANDAEAALNMVKNHRNIDSRNMGIIGHSEGGIIAFILASKMKDLKFAIALAGVTIPCDQLLVLQQSKILLGNKVPEEVVDAIAGMNTRIYDMLKTEKNIDTAYKKAFAIYDDIMLQFDSATLKKYAINKQMTRASVALGFDKWFSTFIRFKPVDYLEKMKTNVLALFGSKDVQVPAAENEDFFKQYAKTAKGKTAESKIFVGMNHLFQKCKTGLPDEYAMIEETIDPEVLAYLENWIKNITRKP